MKPEPLTTKEELSQNISQILSEQEKAELDFEFYLNELEEFFMNDFKEQRFPKMIIQYIKTYITLKTQIMKDPPDDVQRNTKQHKKNINNQFKNYNYDIKNRIKKLFRKRGYP
jgi:Tfp pilus assembly pilus retraction ATPase PilT